jgi:2'-5' RNA ligase
MRLFLAIVPPEGVRRAAAEVIEALRRPGDGIGWVRAPNLHFTLRFLGEVDDAAVDRAADAAREAASVHAPFEAALGAAGAFPSADRPRVLWLGLSRGATQVTALAASLEDALDRHGFERDGRPFSPHLTVGRIRATGGDWTSLLAGVAPDPGAAAFTVDRIAVIESRLARGGSIYTVREEAVLAGP